VSQEMKATYIIYKFNRALEHENNKREISIYHIGSERDGAC
jgi:hypothetical protein